MVPGPQAQGFFTVELARFITHKRESLCQALPLAGDDWADRISCSMVGLYTASLQPTILSPPPFRPLRSLSGNRVWYVSLERQLGHLPRFAEGFPCFDPTCDGLTKNPPVSTDMLTYAISKKASFFKFIANADGTCDVVTADVRISFLSRSYCWTITSLSAHALILRSL